MEIENARSARSASKHMFGSGSSNCNHVVRNNVAGRNEERCYVYKEVHRDSVIYDKNEKMNSNNKIGGNYNT